MDEAITQVEEIIAAENSNNQTWDTAKDNLDTAENNYKAAKKKYDEVQPKYNHARQALLDCVTPKTAPCGHLIPGHPNSGRLYAQ